MIELLDNLAVIMLVIISACLGSFMEASSESARKAREDERKGRVRVAEERADKAMREIVELGGESFHFKKCVIRKHMIDLEAEVREECARIAEDYAKHYPLKFFPDPEPGKHGKTVDSCSARSARHTSKVIAKTIRERRGDEE